MLDFSVESAAQIEKKDTMHDSTPALNQGIKTKRAPSTPPLAHKKVKKEHKKHRHHRHHHNEGDDLDLMM